MPGWLRRKPRITEDLYGRLITSFGRVVDRDPLVSDPAAALAEKVTSANVSLVDALDVKMYRGSTAYHLRLLAGAWVMARDGSVPVATAEVFEEALAWKFGPLVKGSGALAHEVSKLARGEQERDLHQDR